ncbi:MAG: MMPL family transporter [Hyphomicrobiaceae bacterium]|nr:MMPL family transporter [Hyphomicrobiaceae bacterium]
MDDDRPHAVRTEGPTERRFLLTFGIERLGLVALSQPLISLVLIVLLSVVALFGVLNLKVDDSLSELFRTNTPEFKQYEIIDRRFPSSEFDVLAVVEGKNLLTREGLKAFADLAVELQLTDGVGGLVSMLSARGAPDQKGYPPPIVPDTLPDGPAFDAMVATLRANEIVKGKFLSDDGRLALLVMALDRETVAKLGSRAVIEGIRKAGETALKGSGLTIKLTGAPVMQLEIRNAVERDRLVYNGLGFLLGTVTAFIFFRRLSLTLLAVLGPSIAILWTLGVVGGLDFRLNLFINVLTPLILVSGFSDSMHLVFSIRRDIMAGIDRVTAARNAVTDVAPACLLTAMNAALALLSFSMAESALIRTFGVAALLAVAISYLAVATVVPTLAVFLIQKEKVPEKPDHEPGDDGAVHIMGVVSQAIVSRIARSPAPWLAAGIAAVVLTGLAYSQLKPQYRLADQVPDKEQALDATSRLDKKLTGANPVHIMIEWQGPGLYDAATLKVIGEAHDVLEQRAGLGNVWSLESLRRWLERAGGGSVDKIQKYVSVMPEHLRDRFIAKDRKSVLVTGRLPDVDASKILPLVEKIDRELDPVRKANPGYRISVTGLPAIAARNSATLIGELNWGLIGDMFVIFIFLGIALRSILTGVNAILPSLFPIFATGTLLWLNGQGLQFASIIAITVAFSLAIDSTIHFLNRFDLEERRLAPTGASTEAALVATIHHIGPAVVLTTIVLALGLGVTMLSDLPSLRLFGVLTAVCLTASLIGQLVILPASIATYRQFVPWRPSANR